MNKLSIAFILLLLIMLISCNKKDIEYHSVTGYWRCEEFNPVSGNRVYMVDIDKSNSDSTVYLLSNFYNEDVNEFVFANLRGSILSIPEQAIVSVIVKSGAGIVSADFTTIEFDYNIYDGMNDIKVQASYSRP